MAVVLDVVDVEVQQQPPAVAPPAPAAPPGDEIDEAALRAALARARWRLQRLQAD